MNVNTAIKVMINKVGKLYFEAICVNKFVFMKNTTWPKQVVCYAAINIMFQILTQIF